MSQLNRLRLGSVERSILAAIVEHGKPVMIWNTFVELALGYSEVVAWTRGKAKWSTHKTAITRAVWSLREKKLVSVDSLAWVLDVWPGNSNEYFQPKRSIEIPDNIVWYGGDKPRIRRVRLCPDASDYMPKELAEKYSDFVIRLFEKGH